MRNIIKFSAVLLSVFSLIIYLYKETYMILGYKHIYILPLTFLLIILSSFLLNHKKSHTYFFFLIYSFIRLVIIPIVSILSNNYSSVLSYSPNSLSIGKSIYLMSYEIIVVNIFLLLYIGTKNIYNYNDYEEKLLQKKELTGSKKIYVFYIIFSALIFLIYGRNNIKLSLFVIKSSEIGERIGDSINFLDNVITQITLAGIVYTYLLCVDYMYNRNTKNSLNKSLAVSMVNMGVIVGERRSLQLYTAYSTFQVLKNYFSNKKKKLYIFVLVLLFILVSLTSVYKFFNVFLYGSYSEALKNVNPKQENFSQIISAYFAGIDLTAISIELSELKNHTIFDMIFDFFRSIFGINFLFKHLGTLTTETFNTFLYGYHRESGQLMTSLGYGYYYLGTLLSPIPTIFNTYIALIMEKKYIQTKSVELLYIYSYIFLRFATNIFQAPPALINVGTTYFITMGSIYFIAKTLRKNERKVSENNEY